MVQQIDSYKDLIVWQKSMTLVCAIYKLTSLFPAAEKYGLVSQMRRCAVSIPTNIAEGKRRLTRKDFQHFVTIAYSSGAELETEIEIAKNLGFAEKSDYQSSDELLLEVMKMLNSLINKLKK